MTEFAIALASSADTSNRMRLALSALMPDIGSLKSRSGLLDGGGAVTLTSGMGVNVSALRGYVQGAGSTQGGYYVCSDATKALTFADGGASNRTDLIVGRVYHDAFDSSGFTKFAVEIFQGTPGAGTPATPAGSILLAQKVITAGMSAGTGGLGTVPVDKRPPVLVAKGGILPVVDATDRATLATYKGLTIYRIDTAVVEQHNGTGWVGLRTVRPAAFMYQGTGASQTILNNTATQLAYDSTDFDTDGLADLAGDRFVVVTAGVYRLTAAVAWSGVGGGSAGYRQTEIFVNGVSRFITRQNAVSGTVGTFGVQATGLAKLAVGDIVICKVTHTQGASLATAAAANPGYVSLSAEYVSS